MTADAAAIALAMDELLLDPGRPDTYGRDGDDGAVPLPPWVRQHLDQLDAATSETARGIDGSPTIGRRLRRPARTLPEWVRLGALHTYAGYVTGRAPTCVCAPDPRCPRPLVASAWRPRLVTCREHADLHHVGMTPDGDRTCDGCGHPCAGLPDDPIWPVVLGLGPLTYLLGVCRACRWEDHHAAH